ncbi:MAG TPA: hypothetical protein VNI84_04025 [Pyrinomonadaceae bacterium]|nr:hypothetical protein [Pyrinomonadaceae bacterium]
MIEIFCDNCCEKAFGYEDGKINAFPSGECNAHVVSIELIFDALRKGKGKGMEKLQIFIANNRCIFG